MRSRLTKRLLSGANESRTWRRAAPFTRENLDSLKKRIEDFSPPPALNLLHARILLIGMTKSGKSSTFNTMSSIFRGRISQEALCGTNTVGSLTTEYRQYPIRSALTGKSLNFYLCDTCGIDQCLGPQTAEFKDLLKGHLPIGYQFNQGSEVTSRISGFKKHPKLEDKVHCVVFVIDGSTVNITPQWAWDKLNEIQSVVNTAGIPRLVFLTKIDKMSEIIADDLSKVYERCEVKNVVNTVTRVLGVPELNVLPIKNYSNEMDLEEKTSILALTALDKALAFVEDFFLSQVESLERNKNGQMGQLKFFVIAGCIVFVTLLVYIYTLDKSLL